MCGRRDRTCRGGVLPVAMRIGLVLGAAVLLVGAITGAAYAADRVWDRGSWWVWIGVMVLSGGAALLLIGRHVYRRRLR